MRRREFFTLLTGAAVAWPLSARPQSPSMPVIGFLNIGSPRTFAAFLAAFHKGLNAAGYAEGRNVAIEYRWAEGNYDWLHEHAADLVRRKVMLIVATGGLVSALAAKKATDTIPVLFVGGIDPVAEGLVTSINRPGGNATGVNLNASELTPKRLELLRELVPGTVKFAALLNPKDSCGPIREARPRARRREDATATVGPRGQHGGRPQECLQRGRRSGSWRSCGQQRWFLHEPAGSKSSSSQRATSCP